MITLFFIVLVVMAIVMGMIAHNLISSGDDGFYQVFASYIMGFMALLVFLIGMAPKIQTIATANTIDQSIEMYQEENAKIEESIGTAVRGYMEYEKETYESITDKDAINLAQVYPELQSNTLVQKQIEVYVQNNMKIKELRQEKIDLAKVRWDLCFGR